MLLAQQHPRKRFAHLPDIVYAATVCTRLSLRGVHNTCLQSVQRICNHCNIPTLAPSAAKTPFSLMQSCHFSRAQPPTAARGKSPILHKAFKASVTLQVLSCMSTPAADAAPTKRPTQRVQDILDHLKQHPITVTSQPMQYDAEPSTTLPQCIQGLTPADVVDSSDAAESHMARVIAGLLYVACGGLDHAHNLVTPLCWGSWTPYGGKPVANSAAAADAAYVHAIIHRQEGQCIGEFGSGFSNANYWYRAAGQHPVAPDLLKEAQKLAKGHSKCEAHIAKHGSSWDPIKFVSLCSEVADKKDPDLLRFCEGVMAAEFQMLLDYCYAKL